MNLNEPLKLQSYLDGELSPRERRRVAARLERDADYRALFAELQAARQTLQGNEPVAVVPESREFYWSKIERGIVRAERQPEPASAGNLLRWLRRILVPAASFAVLILAIMVMVPPRSGGIRVENEPSDGGVLTYRDHANQMTLVWLPFPASEPEVDYEAPPAGDAQ